MGIGFQTAASRAIDAERQRQISVEGWTPEHDDQHDDGSLLQAAVFYYQNAVRGNLTFHAYRVDAHTYKG